MNAWPFHDANVLSELGKPRPDPGLFGRLKREWSNRLLTLLLGHVLIFYGISCTPPAKKMMPFETVKKMVLEGNNAALNEVLSATSNFVIQRDRWDSSTLLHIACSSTQNKETVSLLLNVGSDPNAQDDLGRTPLHNAYKFGALQEVIELLVKHGAKSEVLDKYGKKPSDYRR